jgi:membrane-bound lytic murein transglycosylase D
MKLKMTRNILGLTLYALLLSTAAKAGGYQQTISPVVTVPGDTTIQNDTTPVLNDLKKGFRNLFIGSSIGEGISTGQLNPQAISFVQDYMARHSRGLQKMKDWGRPYFDMMDAVLTRHGLPKELKYLAVIESHLKAGAVSWAGAVGPWQFMPATARRYGLVVTRQYDERTDYVKSTQAASRMLKDLFKQYGDWLLVIAAYNGGPGNVNAAIRRTGSRDFWTLQHRLPNESKDHVKKFISTHYIMEGEGGITTLTRNEMKDAMLNNGRSLTKEEMDQSATQTVGGRYNAAVIAKYTGITIAEFNRYNPGFNVESAASGTYLLRLPRDKMAIFIARKYEILEESIQLLLQQATGN